MDNQFISYLGLGVIFSVSIFLAFKAGHIFGQNSILNSLYSIELEKQKFEAECLLKELCHRGNIQFREGISFREIIDNHFFADEPLKDQVIGLQQICVDLFMNGFDSIYFLKIVELYSSMPGLSHIHGSPC